MPESGHFPTLLLTRAPPGGGAGVGGARHCPCKGSLIAPAGRALNREVADASAVHAQPQVAAAKAFFRG